MLVISRAALAFFEARGTPMCSSAAFPMFPDGSISTGVEVTPLPVEMPEETTARVAVVPTTPNVAVA